MKKCLFVLLVVFVVVIASPLPSSSSEEEPSEEHFCLDMFSFHSEITDEISSLSNESCTGSKRDCWVFEQLAGSATYRVFRKAGCYETTSEEDLGFKTMEQSVLAKSCEMVRKMPQALTFNWVNFKDTKKGPIMIPLFFLLKERAREIAENIEAKFC